MSLRLGSGYICRSIELGTVYLCRSIELGSGYICRSIVLPGIIRSSGSEVQCEYGCVLVYV